LVTGTILAFKDKVGLVSELKMKVKWVQLTQGKKVTKVGRGKQMIRTEAKWFCARCIFVPCSNGILTNRRRK